MSQNRNDRNPSRNPSPDSLGAPDLDTARERALDLLTAAYAQDRLPLDDYERRARAVQQARDAGDIALITADLPVSAPDTATRQAPGARPDASPHASPHRFPVEPKHGPQETIACIMSDRRMSGDWLASDAVTGLTIMGSTTMDLRDTTLPPGRLRIELLTLMGETKIIVPPGLPVRLSAFPLMAEARLDDRVPRRVDPDSPWVEVSGMAVMGEIRVIVKD